MARLDSKQLLAAALVAASPAAAFAASPSVAGTVEPAAGFKVGAARVNPTLELEFRSDSAAAFVPEEGTAAPKQVGDVIFHIRPGLRLQAPSESLELALDVGYDRNQFLGSEEEVTSDYSRDGWNVDFNAVANKSGNVRFEVGDRFVRSDRQPSTLSLAVDTISNRNDLTARFQFRSGENWVIAPSYTLTTESFESFLSDEVAAGIDYDQFDHTTHTGRLDARYAVFGRSAILLDASYAAKSYVAEDSRFEDVGNLRLQAGLSGMLSQKLGYTAKVGFGSQTLGDPKTVGDTTYYAEGREGFSGVIGAAELAWFASEGTDLRLGYTRSFAADPGSVYYTDDRIGLEAGTLLGSRLGVKAGVSYDMLTFGNGVEDRDGDTLLRLHVGPEYAFNQYFSAGLRYAFTSRTSELVELDPAYGYREYDRHELGAKVSFVY